MVQRSLILFDAFYYFCHCIPLNRNFQFWKMLENSNSNIFLETKSVSVIHKLKVTHSCSKYQLDTSLEESVGHPYVCYTVHVAIVKFIRITYGYHSDYSLWLGRHAECGALRTWSFWHNQVPQISVIPHCSNTHKSFHISDLHNSDLQSQKAVAAHWQSKQLLPFDFARHNSCLQLIDPNPRWRRGNLDMPLNTGDLKSLVWITIQTHAQRMNIRDRPVRRKNNLTTHAGMYDPVNKRCCLDVGLLLGHLRRQ